MLDALDEMSSNVHMSVLLLLFIAFSIKGLKEQVHIHTPGEVKIRVRIMCKIACVQRSAKVWLPPSPTH